MTKRKAKAIITAVRLGATLTKACEDNGEDFLEALDLMRDDKVMVGNLTFGDAYRNAVQDRCVSWEDQALQAYDNLSLQGNRTDHAKMKQAEAQANIRLKLAKEQKGKTSTNSGGPTVVLRRFTIEET